MALAEGQPEARPPERYPGARNHVGRGTHIEGVASDESELHASARPGDQITGRQGETQAVSVELDTEMNFIAARGIIAMHQHSSTG